MCMYARMYATVLRIIHVIGAPHACVQIFAMRTMCMMWFDYPIAQCTGACQIITETEDDRSAN